MLKEQLRVCEEYPDEVKLCLIDDGSPEDAYSIVKECASLSLFTRIELYRIGVDFAWNRGGARNLGALQAKTDWIVHVDIDHVLTPECAQQLLKFNPDSRHWYRFERFRRGAADETRNKDAIARSETYGKIKPHIDSYLCTKDIYWKTGGYNENFTGCLGGGTEFLGRLENTAQAPILLPADIYLQVYTRSVVEDASDWSLSRDRMEGKRRASQIKLSGDTMPKNSIRFPWTRQL